MLKSERIRLEIQEDEKCQSRGIRKEKIFEKYARRSLTSLELVDLLLKSNDAS